jgi:hypothetical protein
MAMTVIDLHDSTTTTWHRKRSLPKKWSALKFNQTTFQEDI